ncbi:hypothetical protein COO91_10625 (plasmid) [Nostoc flagelliforme CCNUN1]|uniref:Uncharacterized protein n=1 Tax=Nostoc flagelliforme CCNUN1 TaxID=2038116 RepID=A0A2K8T9Q5_9NOSO|nr:hypothetical protein COO91_10625 [Nostoc flagelliforme CCNUN1]
MKKSAPGKNAQTQVLKDFSPRDAFVLRSLPVQPRFKS